MSEWWTYRLSSFVLFSPRTYVRQMELYNSDVWPLQLLTVIAAVAIAALARRDIESRAIPLALAATWSFVAWAFDVRRYAAINWAASYFAIAFVAQAVLLAWHGAVRGPMHFGADRVRRRAAVAVVAFALIGMPLAQRFAGRDWHALEWFGVAPDPTVVGTLGVLMMLQRAPPWRLLALPLAWCVVNGAFQWTVGVRDALMLPAAALLVGAMRLATPASRPPRPSAR